MSEAGLDATGFQRSRIKQVLGRTAAIVQVGDEMNSMHIVILWGFTWNAMTDDRFQ